jgi:hypothetical protein
MTQLNLSGSHSTTARQSTGAEENSVSIRKQTWGALGALVGFAALIGIGSCSRPTPKPVATPMSQPLASLPSPVAPASSAPAARPASAKSRKRRPATVSYVNRAYGVSFRFPRQYSLKSGDEAQLSWGDLGPFQMDFVRPGGVTLVAVRLPENSYPGTDFKSAFVNLSVNPSLTSEACTQFVFPEANSGAGSAEDRPAQVTLGGRAFSEMESSASAASTETDARYYHAFGHGACYEFALGIGTGGLGTDGITPVDRERVFGQLEKILATVQLQPPAVPQTEAPAASAAGTVPGATVKAPE